MPESYNLIAKNWKESLVIRAILYNWKTAGQMVSNLN